MQSVTAVGHPTDTCAPGIAQILDYLRPSAARFEGKVETIDLGNGAKVYHFLPDGRVGRNAEIAYFDIHGGGFTSGGGVVARA